MRKMTEAGIDVSKAVLDVAVRRDERRLETARFDNDAAGHQKLGALADEGRAHGARRPGVDGHLQSRRRPGAASDPRDRGHGRQSPRDQAVHRGAHAALEDRPDRRRRAARLRRSACRSWPGSRPPRTCWSCAGSRGASPPWSSSGPANAIGCTRCRPRPKRSAVVVQRHRGEHPPSRAAHRAALGPGGRAHRRARRAPDGLRAPRLGAGHRRPQRRAAPPRAARAARRR